MNGPRAAAQRLHVHPSGVRKPECVPLAARPKQNRGCSEQLHFHDRHGGCFLLHLVRGACCARAPCPSIPAPSQPVVARHVTRRYTLQGKYADIPTVSEAVYIQARVLRA